MIPLLVPRRPDGGRRDRLRDFSRDWWEINLPDLKWVEGHHLVGPFNRSAAVNTAARDAGEWDVAVIADADVVWDPAQLQAAIDNARATGRCTLAYTDYVALNQHMTDRVLEGFDGNWTPGAELRMRKHVSSLVVVPRPLWDAIGGMEERLQGWGHDDLVLIDACRVLGGGIDRVPGTVWHLWHPHTPERQKNPNLRACAALAKRYQAAVTPQQMRQLIAERDVPNGVCLVVVTNGRRDCLERTLPGAYERLVGLPIVRTIISDDSADPDYQAWLRLTFPDAELLTDRKVVGFGGNTRRAWEAALSSGQEWTFWLEDDFVLERDVDLAAMARTLGGNPQVAQMALRRQAWFKPELEAGGVIEQDPGAYTDRGGWLEHSKFWTTNPHLVHRSVLAAHEWTDRPHSERLFSNEILRTRTVGYWGNRTDEPWVTHIGERAGTGY